MKKAKIMLLSLAVVAVVSGALAFKVNSKFSRAYCFRLDTVSGPCEGGLSNKTAIVGNNWYTPTSSIADCKDETCNTKGDLMANQ
jgi:hypothetical protein